MKWIDFENNRVVKPSQIYSEPDAKASIGSLLGSWEILDFRPPEVHESYITRPGGKSVVPENVIPAEGPRFVVDMRRKADLEEVWE